MNFFSEMKPIRNFLDFDVEGLYQPAPSDWFVLITDVQNSTEAIRNGLYKQVNMVGASSIVAVANVLSKEMFPFVFGGDGATMLISDEKKTDVECALRASQFVAKEYFNLHLRVGFISVRDLIKQGHSVAVGRYELPGGPSIAFFRGDGFEVAEKLVKSGVGILSVGSMQNPEDVMAGLSCRWAPLECERDSMLSIMIKTTVQGEAQKVLQDVVQKINLIVDFESPATHPVKHSITGSDLLSSSKIELQSRGRWGQFFSKRRMAICFEMLVARLLLWAGWTIKGFDMRAYKKSLPLHSDFRKFDTVLRMIIDCTDEMSKRIHQILLEKKNLGLLYYGIHVSPSALMTCFVKSTEAGEHIHFIDGSNGGYALAAAQMKKQMYSAKKIDWN